MSADASWERVVADALVSPDPAAALARAADERATPPELGAALRRARPDGVRVAALLVARLRFERLVRGSRDASEWFARDPAAFVAVFRAYHAAVPPRAAGPEAEAAAFDAWRPDDPDESDT